MWKTNERGLQYTFNPTSTRPKWLVGCVRVVILDLEVDEFAGEWAEGNVKAELRWKRPPTDCHTSPAFFCSVCFPKCRGSRFGEQKMVELNGWFVKTKPRENESCKKKYLFVKWSSTKKYKKNVFLLKKNVERNTTYTSFLMNLHGNALLNKKKLKTPRFSPFPKNHGENQRPKRVRAPELVKCCHPSWAKMLDPKHHKHEDQNLTSQNNSSGFYRVDRVHRVERVHSVYMDTFH